MLGWVGKRVRVARYVSRAAALGASALLIACGLDMGGLQETGGADGGNEDATIPDATLEGSVDSGSIDAAGGHDALGADSGAGDVGFVEPDSGTPPGSDSGGDADASGTDGCVPTGPEICTDGIDNDCNGLTDCADPACMTQGYACVAPPPGGWTFVAFAPAAPESQTACPTSLGTTSVDVDPINTPATCTCSCNVGTLPTCTGMVTSKLGTNGSCGMPGVPAPADGSCSMFPVSVGADVQVGNPAGSGGSCVSDAGIAAPPAGSTKGEICSGEKAFGAGCSAGQVCALAPAPFGACIAKNGQDTCPAQSYATVHYVGQLNDTRSCTNCQCGGTPMCALTWSFYTTPKCNGNPALVVTADGTCQPTGAAATPYTSNMLVGDATGATCAPPAMQPMPTGQVALNAEQTICCE
jgi:hypothetical protein